MARKHIIAPLTIEYAHTPGHEGMLSFLDITPEQARQRNDGIVKNDRGSLGDRGPASDSLPLNNRGSLEARGSSEASQSFAGQTVPRRVGSSGDYGQLRDRALEIVRGRNPSITRGGFGTTIGQPRPAKRQPKIHSCSRVQDGHSAIEQAVYNALWTRGKPEVEGSDTRIVHAGHAELMRLTSLVRNALKANLRSLAEKQAIEMLNGYNSVDNRPSGYRVRGYKDILNRRKAAGMVYVVRGRSVRFCDEQGGELTTGAVLDIAPDSPPTLAADPKPLDESSRLAEMLSGIVDMDSTARRDLIAACKAESPSVRIEEIARVATEMAKKTGSNARNPVGFLLTVVPRQFESRGLEQSRARWQAEDEAGKRHAVDEERKAAETSALLEEQVARLRGIETDPSASADDRAYAAKTLRQIGR